MHGHIYKIRLSDGLAGRRQAMAYQRIYNAQIVQRNDSYMAIVDVKAVGKLYQLYPSYKTN